MRGASADSNTSGMIIEFSGGKYSPDDLLEISDIENALDNVFVGRSFDSISTVTRTSGNSVLEILSNFTSDWTFDNCMFSCSKSFLLTGTSNAASKAGVSDLNLFCSTLVESGCILFSSSSTDISRSFTVCLKSSLVKGSSAVVSKSGVSCDSLV